MNATLLPTPTAAHRNRQIKADANKAVTRLAKWFVRHPGKTECAAEGWYGRIVRVRHRSIRKDIFNAARQAMAPV